MSPAGIEAGSVWVFTLLPVVNGNSGRRRCRRTLSRGASGGGVQRRVGEQAGQRRRGRGRSSRYTTTFVDRFFFFFLFSNSVPLALTAAFAA